MLRLPQFFTVFLSLLTPYMGGGARPRQPGLSATAVKEDSQQTWQRALESTRSGRIFEKALMDTFSSVDQVMDYRLDYRLGGRWDETKHVFLGRMYC